jgi:hypothetical protein
MSIIQPSATRRHRFTHLSASIIEEDDSFVVQVRLHNDAMSSPEGTAWGEEIAESIESAAEMIAVLAERFSIPQDRITLEIRMEDMAENTRH